jgi:hypothetical protein
MGWLETNIFPITNLGELSGRYRLCRVLGLNRQQADYYQNRQHLERLSFLLKRPVEIVERGDELYLAVPEDVAALPAEYELVRTVVQFRPTDEMFTLDYTKRNRENDTICLRFLRFLIQSPLRQDRRLWQPGAGQPFFERVPAHGYDQFHHFVGFAVRPVITPADGLGLCVDPTARYVSRTPIPARVNRDDFNRMWKGRSYIYHFADTWYEIRAEGLADRNVSDYRFIAQGEQHTLLDYVLKHASKPISSELAQLPHDTAVVLYRNNHGQELAAPAALCYRVLDTSGGDVRQEHSVSILQPDERRQLTARFVSRHMRALEVPGARLQVDERPVQIAERWFNVPDLRFGNSVILSVQGTRGARQTDLSQLGQTRVQLLRDRTAGFFVNDPLDRHYILLPRTVHDSFGEQFVQDLHRAVEELFPQGGYAPMVVPYDDRGPRTFHNQGRHILEAAKANCAPGYAIVMIHETEDRRPGKEDQLGAMLMRELRERHDLRVAITHTEMPRHAYREEHSDEGARRYRCDDKYRKRFSGYLRNVALNHVLLNNQRWPFVLAKQLHADITIGIDVKHNTCGLVVVGGNGSRVRWFFRTSRQKERLLPIQVERDLTQLIREDVENRGGPVHQIVLHQDGHAWAPHLEGARRALDRLQRDGILAPDADLTVLEISKSSPAPLRLYTPRFRNGSIASAENPQVGRYYLAGDEAYLCSTGRAFPRPGTVRPLHVRRVMGSLTLEHALEDLFCLTLPWTRPEDCTRYPITLKLNDRFLRAEAGEYDSDALAFAGLEEEEVA